MGSVLNRVSTVAIACIMGCPAIAASTDAEMIKDAENAMLMQLKDPDSAKFRDEFVKVSAVPGVSYVCAQVNAKNSYGGYGGFEMFVYFSKTAPAHIAGQAFTSEGLKNMELVHPFGAPIPNAISPDEWGTYLMFALCGNN